MKTLYERMSKDWQDKFNANSKEFPSTGKRLKGKLDSNTNYFTLTFGDAFELSLALGVGIEELSDCFKPIE